MAFSAASDAMLAFALRGAFGTIPPAPLVQPAASTSAGPAAASVQVKTAGPGEDAKTETDSESSPGLGFRLSPCSECDVSSDDDGGDEGGHEVQGGEEGGHEYQGGHEGGHEEEAMCEAKLEPCAVGAPSAAEIARVVDEAMDLAAASATIFPNHVEFPPRLAGKVLPCRVAWRVGIWELRLAEGDQRVVCRAPTPARDISSSTSEAASRLTTRWVRAAGATGEWLPAARASERADPAALLSKIRSCS